MSDTANIVVIAYVRVSSQEQESGYGPEIQEEGIRAYCLGKGLPEPEVVHESASAENISGRTEFIEVMRRAKAIQQAGGQAHVIFHKLDRLSRNLIDQEATVLQALQYGHRLHSTNSAETEVLDPHFAGDPMRTAMRQMVGIFNQLERATIQGRLDAGLHAKARIGGWTGGRPPFGYKAVRENLEVDPTCKAPIIRAFQMDRAGVDRGTIATTLAREYPEHCARWNHVYVRRLLLRADLYARGMYRPRLGAHAVLRPELIILPPDLTKARISHRTRVMDAVDWSTVKRDPFPAPSLALLLRVSPAHIQSIVVAKNIPVTWHKARMMIALAHAPAVEAAILAGRQVKAEESKPAT